METNTIDTATSVAWTAWIATAALSKAYLQSLVVYYEPKNESLCRAFFTNFIEAAGVSDEHKNLILAKNFQEHNLQLKTTNDFLESLRRLRAAIDGSLLTSGLLLVVSIFLYINKAADAVAVSRWLASLSLSAVVGCILWVIIYTFHLENWTAILEGLLLKNIDRT